MGKPETRWNRRPDGSVFLSHLLLDTAAVEQLDGAKWLTLWNVRLGPGVALSDLQLVWLDLRGGTRTSVEDVGDCHTLRGLCINQVRGLTHVDPISRLANLEILDLYGLSKVTRLPDLSGLEKLRRLDIGQMRALSDWRHLTSPPHLQELQFQNHLRPDPDVMAQMSQRPSLVRFGWSAPDEPRKVVDPIRDSMEQAAAKWQNPEEWLAQNTPD